MKWGLNNSRGSITVEAGVSFSFFIIMCVVLISFVNGNRYEEVVRQSLYETSWEVSHLSPESADIMMPLLLSKNIYEKSSTSSGLDGDLIKYENGVF